MIQVRQLTKRFGQQLVLDRVQFDIAAGESVAIIGRSGVGKSVILKHLIGLLQPDEGEVSVQGENLSQMSERQLLKVRGRFGMLFQGAALFDSMTVAQNIAFALRGNPTLGADEVRRRIAEVLELVEMPGIEEKMPVQLSGGMQKRVGLARAIVHRPEIILYDEPTTGLDPVSADSIDQLMMRVCERLKVTSIVVTHDMRTARRLGRRILMVRGGRIYLDDAAENVFKSQDPVVRQFVDGVADLKEVLFV